MPFDVLDYVILTNDLPLPRPPPRLRSLSRKSERLKIALHSSPLACYFADKSKRSFGSPKKKGVGAKRRESMLTPRFWTVFSPLLIARNPSDFFSTSPRGPSFKRRSSVITTQPLPRAPNKAAPGRGIRARFQLFCPCVHRRCVSWHWIFGMVCKSELMSFRVNPRLREK